MTEVGTTYDMPSARPPRRVEGRAYLLQTVGDGPEVVPLPLDERVSVGRSHSCDLRIDDPGVSRLHLTLEWDGGSTVTLVDRGSRNGTRVDGRRIEGTLEIGSGADIEVGGHHLLLLVQGQLRETDRPLPPIDDDGLVAHAPAMLRAVDVVDRAARTHATVLLIGETGTGKEILARRVHEQSERGSGPFIAVNCAAIPDTLAESTLFGHVRGAFTGAHRDKPGVFEEAHGGTLFLDEVAELSASTQGRLLRVLEERRVTRVGAVEPTPIDVRLVAATHRQLGEQVDRGLFRADLLFRLDVVRIVVPPLRERVEDVLPLARRFLAELSPGHRVTLTAMAERALLAETWPGNVRELRNRIERALAMRRGPVIDEADLVQRESGQQLPSRRKGGQLKEAVDDVERDTIMEALRACKGNQTRAAKRLGISRRTLVYRIDKYDLKDFARGVRGH